MQGSRLTISGNPRSGTQAGALLLRGAGAVAAGAAVARLLRATGSAAAESRALSVALMGMGGALVLLPSWGVQASVARAAGDGARTGEAAGLGLAASAGADASSLAPSKADASLLPPDNTASGPSGDLSRSGLLASAVSGATTATQPLLPELAPQLAHTLYGTDGSPTPSEDGDGHADGSSDSGSGSSSGVQRVRWRLLRLSQAAHWPAVLLGASLATAGAVMAAAQRAARPEPMPPLYPTVAAAELSTLRGRLHHAAAVAGEAVREGRTDPPLLIAAGVAAVLAGLIFA